ncbi:hypothetical protein Q9R20_04405 [Microbacterium sp. PRF11]|uniref:hypothetical protein n=1 Tax=Microbacterium sp. PRF11 TaxID=2962593 RepID=UPI00288134C1|nr:hypothetical protein [Microbacterium sp. PRF11]MDT0116227.1 hypothetical protein [Microbacterium sp. PRF11]
MSRGAQPGREGLSETSGDDVPWGRPAVAGIPLPPFRDAAEQAAYVLSLQTFLALLDEGEPAAGTIALMAALAAEVARGNSEAFPQLSPLALGVSLSTFFPAPWTPKTLAAALAPLGAFTPRYGWGSWGWGGDPDYRATPHRGGWAIERHERGSRTHATMPHEGDLVLLWMDMYRNRFPYPIAHRLSASAQTPDALAAAARATRAAHAVNVAKPYLQTWREEREQALLERPGGPEPLR